MNIYLIGYRCTGKTSVGRVLAEKLGWRFIDTDQTVVASDGLSISEMVEKHGWPFFRRLEKQAFLELSKGSRQVAATGGGIILDPENRALLKDPAHFTVWLRASRETIYQRLQNDGQTRAFRPSLTDSPLLREIAETLAERTPYYESVMDMAIDTDQQAVAAICELILQETANARKQTR